MTAIDWKVQVGEQTTTARYESPTNGDEHTVFVCAHGAGGNMMDRGVLATANALRSQGFARRRGGRAGSPD